MEIEIRKWEKYNPKRDQKTYTWLRLDNTIATGPEFYGLNNREKFLAILLLCEASKTNNGRFWLEVDWFADKVAEEPVEFVLATIDKLSKKNRKGESFVIIHSPYVDPNQTKLLPEEDPRPDATAHDRALSDDVVALQTTTPTYERTDGRNERTDGRFDNKPTFQVETNYESEMSEEEISVEISGILKQLEHSPMDSPSETGNEAVGA